jgi:hypothetical protein
MPAKAVLELLPSGGIAVAYALVPFNDGSHVRRVRNEDFAAAFRQGAQTPQSLENLQTLIFPNFSLGLGRDRIDSDSAFKVDERRRFFDATADTRWVSASYLPIQEEDSTHTGLEVIRASTVFKGDLWSIWEDDTGDDIVARKYTGSTTTWEGGGRVFNLSGEAGDFSVGLDLIGQKTHLLALLADRTNHRVYRSTDGATWAVATTLPTLGLLTNKVTNHDDGDFGLLADIGGEAVAILRHEDIGTITFFSSSDAGDNWTDEAVDIASGNGPQGAAVLAGIDNEDKLYVGTREGLWEVDTAPSTWTFRLIFPMVPHNSNGRRMKVHSDGALWFAQGVDDDSPPIVYRMFVSNGQRTIEKVPNDFSLGDPGPAEMMGPIRWMEPAQGMMYIAVGGGKAGRNARIFCHNGQGWHSVRRHGTENQKIEWLAASADDDGTPRLHYAVRTSSAVSDANFLGQAFVDPASGTSIKREATWYVDLPFIDFGHPHESKNVMRIGINAKDLGTTSSEYINVDYGSAADLGIPTARGSFTNLGDFVATTDRITLPSGSTVVGLSVRTFALRVNLITDTAGNTTTPALFDVAIDGLVVLGATDVFEFQVDLKESDALLEGEPGATIAKLNTARSEVLLLALTYADLGTIYVHIPPDGISYKEQLISPDSIPNVADPSARRQGTALVRVVQPIL